VFQNHFASSVWYTGILSSVNDLQHGAFSTQIVTEDEQNTFFKLQKIALVKLQKVTDISLCHFVYRIFQTIGALKIL